MSQTETYNGFRMVSHRRCDGPTIYQLIDDVGCVRQESDSMAALIAWAHSQPEVETDPLRIYNTVREDQQREDELEIRGDAA